MKKYTVNMVRHWLGGSVKSVWLGMETLDYENGICLLDEQLTQLDPQSLYIGSPDTLCGLLDIGAVTEAGAFVITCKGTDVQRALPRGMTLIQTELTLTALYNLIHENVHRYAGWTGRMQQIVYENEGLEALLKVASEELDATIVLINPGYKMIAAYYNPRIRDALSEELQTNGYLGSETIRRIHTENPMYAQPERNVSVFTSSADCNTVIVHRLCYRNTFVASMVVILAGQEQNPCYADLSDVVAGYVGQIMFSSQGADYSSNAALGSLVADLIECRLSSPEELDQRLKHVKLSVHRYYHLVLVRLNNPSDQGLFPWNYIMAQLQQAFRYCDVTSYRGDILLLARKTSRSSRPPFDQELVQRILEQYDGRAVIGNASEFLPSMAAIYYQAKGALRLGTRMNPEKRIYYFEEYSIYQIIEMAAESEQHFLSSRNLAHLCNNEMIALVLYDKKYGTNLTHVLFTYLSLERNTTEAARALYMHRNTMIYKIRKIEEIIGTTLDSPILRERLMFSCRVLTYMEKYLGEDILKLKQMRHKPSEESKLPQQT